MRKPKRYDKNYTAAENREIFTLKQQGWSNKEIALHMERTEIGISRHWSNINKNKPSARKKTLNGRDAFKIITTMRETVDKLGFKAPFVRVYNDTRLGNGYGFKVMNGASYPEGVWRKCQKAVQKLGYNCTLSHSTNYYDQTQAHSRGIRVYS